MVENEKYIYWLDSHELDTEVVYREMYARIGHIFHNVQMVEYNIANILSIEKYKKKINKLISQTELIKIKDRIHRLFLKYKGYTFGQLEKLCEKSKFLSSVSIESINECKNYRDYLAHQCFKDKLMKNELNTIDDADLFVDELNDFEVKMAKLNDEVLQIFKTCKGAELILKKE